MLCKKLIVALLAVGLSASSAHGWGREGHRVIGEIAWHFLTPEAEAEVERLLQDGRYDSLGEIGNWADAHARLYDTFDDRNTHHYIDVDPEADAVDMARDCPPEGCIIRAIRDLETALGDRSTPKWERAEQFYFLVHFIEDIHQPLHVVHPDMTGGNETMVSFFGEQSKLHRVWDSLMIRRRLKDFEVPQSSKAWEIGPWKRWAYELRFGIDAAQADAWRRDLDPEAWALEAIAPSRQLTFAIEQDEELGDEYYERAMPFIEQQLQKAAIRLAAMLNEVFGAEG